MTRTLLAAALLTLSTLLAPELHAQAVPASLLGRWRVTRVLTTAKTTCWDSERARSLVGTTLVYGPRSLRWQGGEQPLEGLLAVVRTLDRKRFQQEYGVGLDALALAAPSVTEVDLQHEDADVTGGSTEVPGDTAVLAGPGRIVVSACGVYYEALRPKR